MKHPISLFNLLSISFFCSCSTTAWADTLKNIDGILLGRQQEASESRATITPNPSATESDSFTNINPDASLSGSRTKSGSKYHSGSHHGTKSTSIDPRLPPGGVNLMTPAPVSGEQFFKVGDFVTFAWNYTSLSITPTAIDVFASCATNDNLYTIALNQTVKGPTGAVTWDTGDYQATASIPLLVATYTLVIYDASKDVTAIPSAGYLGTFDQYFFGMYTPQPYTPLADFQCATCNGAMSTHERQAVGVLLLTATVTVLSFTWFAGSAGVFS